MIILGGIPWIQRIRPRPTFLLLWPIPTQNPRLWILTPRVNGPETLADIKVKIDDQDWPRTLVPGGPLVYASVFAKASRILSLETLSSNSQNLGLEPTIWWETPLDNSIHWIAYASYRSGQQIQETAAIRVGDRWGVATRVFDAQSGKQFAICRDPIVPASTQFR